MCTTGADVLVRCQSVPAGPLGPRTNKGPINSDFEGVSEKLALIILVIQVLPSPGECRKLRGNPRKDGRAKIPKTTAGWAKIPT
jgi:hypothetical protein